VGSGMASAVFSEAGRIRRDGGRAATGYILGHGGRGRKRFVPAGGKKTAGAGRPMKGVARLAPE